MPDPLRVTPNGLLAASASLNELATQLSGGDADVPAGGGVLGVGGAATGVVTAAAAFDTAYGGQLGNHSQALRVAAGVYITTDHDAAGDIGVTV